MVIRFPNTRFWLSLLAIGVLAFSFWSVRFLGQYQPLAGLMSGPKGLGQIGLQVQEAKVTGRVDGVRRWQVSAHTITFSRDLRQVSVSGLQRGLLFAVDQQPLVSLNAGGAIYQSTTPVFGTAAQGFLQISSGIQAKVLRPFGPVVTASGLTWNPVTNLVQSQGAVSALFPNHAGAAISGAHLTADGVQWGAVTDNLQSSGKVQVVFADNAGQAAGTGVSVNLHTGNLTLNALTGTFNLLSAVKSKMTSKTIHPLLALAAGLALNSAAVMAANTAAAPPQPVTYQAGSSLWLNAQHQAQMSQGVTIKQGDTTLQTQAAVVNFDSQQHAINAKSSTPVHLWDTQSDLTGDHGFIDFTTHVATVKGDVILVVKPGASNANAPRSSLQSRFKHPATLTCTLMQYNYQTKMGVVPGPLTIHQKDRVLTADSGTYNGRTQIITLIGDVHGHEGNNKIQTQKARVGVRHGEEFVRVDVPTEGIFYPPSSKNSISSAGSGPVDDPQGYDAIMNGGPTESAPVPPVSAAAPASGASGTVPPAAPAPSGGAGTGSLPTQAPTP